MQLHGLHQRIDRLLAEVEPPTQWVCPSAVELAEQAGLFLDDWQKQLVSSTHPKILANASRQVGKSTSSAVLSLWTALHADNQLVLIVAPSLRQSAENMRNVIGLWTAIGRPIRAVYESVLSLHLANGSRVIALPGTEQTIRGYAGVDLLVFEEMSRIPDPLYLACLPFLAISKGRQVQISSPFGDRGAFFVSYQHREEFDYYEVPAEACSRIDPDWLAEQRETMGEWYYQSEFCCKCMSSHDACFR